MKSPLSIVALLVASVALVVAWTARGDAPRAAAPRSVDLAPLVARIEALERERERAPAPVKLESAPPPRESANVPAVDPVGKELEARMTQLEQRVASAAATEGKVVPARLLGSRQTNDELRVLARDGTRTEEERLRALGELRGRLEPDGTDARLAVLDDMILLAQTSTDAKTRADVWRQMSGVTDERLKRPMLDALAFDTDAKAREEAAETLGGFRSDPGVAAALRAAMQNDPNARVRRQADEALSGER